MQTPSTDAAHQAALANYARDPLNHPPPAGMAPARAAVYARLVHNNVCGFIRRCFSASMPLADPAIWADLEARFLAQARPHSPYFSDIPPQFLHYAQASGRLPETVLALMDFETTQLAAEITPMSTAAAHAQEHSLLQWSPAAFLRQYSVDFIAHDLAGFTATPSRVLVWRSHNDDVYYRLLDEPEYLFLAHFHTQPSSVAILFAELAVVMSDTDTEALHGWLQTQINTWVAAGVLLPIQENT